VYFYRNTWQWINFVCVFYGFEESQENLVLRDETLYILSDETTTYTQAEERCLSYGTNLAQIDSLDERNFLSSYVQQKYIDSKL